MWILATYLPLIFGDKIPVDDSKWECFLLLLSIIQLCTARVASAALAGILGVLIREHHMLFIKCYPVASIIPKMHYMVHLPQQLLRQEFLCKYVCALVCWLFLYACILFMNIVGIENTKGTYNLFFRLLDVAHGSWGWRGKCIAQINNFKNIAYSVTKRHQRLLCSYLQCSDFFGRELECGPGKQWL